MPWWCAMNDRTVTLVFARRQPRTACSRSPRRSRTRPRSPSRSERAQVRARRLGLDHQRHHAGVRRDDQVVGEPALEAEARHAERAVLVVELRVGLVVAGLRDAPRHAALGAVLDLALDDAAIGLVEQRPVVGRHHEQRHQVLEHRAAPRQQRRPAARRGRGQLPAEAEPVLLRQLALRDRHEARQPRLGGQQVVEAGVEPVVGDVVADREEVAPRS